MWTSTAVEVGTVKRRRHLYLTVYPLLTQHRHTRFAANIDVGRSDVVIHIKAQGNIQTRICSNNLVKLLQRRSPSYRAAAVGDN